MPSERRPRAAAPGGKSKRARADDETEIAASRRKASKATKTPSKRKAPAKKTSTAAPRRRASKGPSVTAPARPPRDWRRWLALEALTWGGGALVGLTFAGWMTWAQARE